MAFGDHRLAGSLGKGAKAQFRIIGALMMREIGMRFGRENLAFGWLIGEPLLFTIPVLIMWSFLRTRAEFGVRVTELCWTGYLPLLLFRHIGGMTIRMLSNNSAMLYHRIVAPLDLVVARVLIETGSNLLAVVFSYVILFEIGFLNFPRNFPMFLIGYLYMIWWCASIGLIVSGFTERSPWVEKIWFPISYMYIAVGGCFYMAEWVPGSVRDFALYQPSLQAYEMIRAGMFGSVVITHADFGYTTAALAILTLIGLASLHKSRKYVEVL